MKALYKFALKSSAIGAIAFLAAAAGCSDTSKDDTSGAAGDTGNSGGSSSTAGSSSKAGTTSGGDDSGGATTAAGGTAAGGESSSGGAPELVGSGGGPDLIFGQGGDVGAGGAGTGPAVGKFCNTLERGGKSTTLRLEIGEGAAMVTFTAKTGECAPVDGNACTELPLGTDVLIQMFDEAKPSTVIDAGTADILPGENWILFSEIDESSGTPEPVFNGGVLPGSAACEDITYADL